MSFSDNICVLLCVDNNFLPQAGIAAFSLVDRNADTGFEIFVAAFARDENLAAICFKPALNCRNCSVKYIDLDNALFSSLPITKHLSRSTYTRIIAARLLDPNYPRVLYLDADILVCGDVTRLWRTSLDGAVLAAVRDHFNPCLDAIGFAPDEFYFNAGVLLIDMVRWRAEDCERRLLAHLARHHASPWMDQDALNVVLRGRVKSVGLEWNFQSRCVDVPAEFMGLSRHDYLHLIKKKSIIHFTTSLKPWNASHRVHYSDQYFAAVRQAGLADYLKRARLQCGADIVAKIKTQLRWHFPQVFRRIRTCFKPEMAAAMYCAGPDEKRI